MTTNWDLYEKRLKINGATTKDRQINLMKDSVANNFSNSPSYRSAYFNNSLSATDIQVLDDVEYYIKKILMKPNDNINVGDIINFDNNTWLCIETDKTNPVYEIGKVYKSTHTITLNKNHISYNYPVVVDSQVKLFSMGTNSNKYITVPDSSIIVYIKNDNITSLIERGEVYNLSGDNYEIVDINRVVMPGLLVLKCEYSQKEQEIETPSTYTISGDSIISLGTTKTYTAIKYVNNIPDSTVQFDFNIVDTGVPSSAYVLTVVDNQNITIRCNQYPYSLTIRATDRSDNTKYVEKQIRLANLF